MMKTTNEYIRLLRDYKRKHAAEYGIERMGIFGSVARNEQKEDSDVDVYFESPSMSLFKMGGLMCDLEDLFGTRVDLIHKHENLQSPFLHRIEKDMIYV
ncbi:MAG: nucleotidyltransferase family protein [Prevotellaceae bacterium]|nr:nucleotidyltransferase family protein [Prevotellaceae bacterium]